MPIINLTSTEEQAHKCGKNVQRIDCNNDGKVIMWTYETHHGLCVKDREHNGPQDSDFYMTVYNPEKDSFDEIQFATTRGWSYPCYGSSPDASPEVMKKWEDHNKKIEKENIERRKISRAKEISFGKEVIVVSGRKLQKGCNLLQWFLSL